MSVVFVQTRSEIPAAIPGPVLYVDLETYGVPPHDGLDLLTNQIRLVAVCGDTGPAYVFDMYRLLTSDIVHLFRRDAVWCGHNLAFDLNSLRRAGLEYPSTCFDTMVASQVLMNGLGYEHGGHSLLECLERYCEIVADKTHQADDWAATELTPEQVEYSGNDVLYLRPLRAKLMEHLTDRRLTATINLECSIIPALVEMTLNGIGVDRDMWLARSVLAEAEVGRVTDALNKLMPLPDEEPYKTVRVKRNGEQFAADVAFNKRVAERNLCRCWNWASWQQLIAAFAKVGVFLPDTTYETIVELQDEHPGLELLLRFKDVEKEATTFGREWLTHLRNERGTDRVHPNWRQLGTESGRMSCADPNVQQLPRPDMKKPRHERVRGAIVASPGRLLVRADFSQIEARIAAKISGDETLSRLFINNTGDIHKFVASRVLNKPEAAVTKEERQIGKSLLFGLLFGMGSKKLKVYCRTNYGVKLSDLEAVEYRSKFFQVFPGLQAWHKRVGRDCDYKDDYRTLLGRRRLIRKKESRYTEALNTPVQGTGGDMIKVTVFEMWQERHDWPGADLVMLIHDEIVYEVVEADAERFSRRLREKMIEVGNHLLDPIPVDVEVKIGPAWSS